MEVTNEMIQHLLTSEANRHTTVGACARSCATLGVEQRQHPLEP